MECILKIICFKEKSSGHSSETIWQEHNQLILKVSKTSAVDTGVEVLWNTTI